MPGMAATMREYFQRKLHSGSKTGPIVRSRKQAIAIALHDQPSKAPSATHPLSRVRHRLKKQHGY